ncbi:MAG: hypothetical protein DMG06_19500 [Acidobacteria bacterium]|nr:MAG: hypothetical protein DMG06_19500 [Acidobacteriota bacterium]
MESIEEKVISRLKAAPAQLMSFRQLVRELEIDSDQRHEVRHLLHEMVKEGTLLKLKGNRYALPEQKSVIVGKLSAHRDGYGFVIPDKWKETYSSRPASSETPCKGILSWPAWRK